MLLPVQRVVEVLPNIARLLGPVQHQHVPHTRGQGVLQDRGGGGGDDAVFLLIFFFFFGQHRLDERQGRLLLAHEVVQGGRLAIVAATI